MQKKAAKIGIDTCKGRYQKMYTPYETIVYRLVYLKRAILSIKPDVLETYHINHSDFMALLYIYSFPGMTQAELADVKHQDRNVIGHTIDRLEENGLAERTKNKADRRTYLLYVTPKGKTAVKECWAYIQKGEDLALSCLSPEERSEFLRLLQKIFESTVSILGEGPIKKIEN